MKSYKFKFMDQCNRVNLHIFLKKTSFKHCFINKIYSHEKL